MFDLFSDSAKVAAQLEIIRSQYGFAIWETLYSLVLEVVFAYVIGLPLGVLMALKADTWIDKLGTFYIVFITAVPSLSYIFMVKTLGYAWGWPTAFDLESTMQIVGTFFHQAGGIGDGAGDISALGAGHGIKHVNALVHHKGFTQVEREEILMDIREAVVAVQKVLVVSAVAQNGGGEFLILPEAMA